jgi:uncharacterized protein YbjT (DUF2867 family)
MRCVVFGATGYIGGRLVPELLSAGHRVRAVARTPVKLADVPWHDEVEIVAGDVPMPPASQRQSRARTWSITWCTR